jgi:Flp pilus assembly protein TadG
MLVTGIVELGLVFSNYLNLTDAVRSGARVASISRELPDPTGTAASAVRSAAGGLTLCSTCVTVAYTGLQPGADVTVTASYPYTISILGIPVRSGWLKSSTTERVE